MKTHISLFLFFFLSVAQLATAEEIIENKTFENGLQLKDKKDVIIRNCHISNPEGHALFLSNCENVIIEKCIIRKAGNEKNYDIDARTGDFNPNYIFCNFLNHGIYLRNCRK